MRFQFHWDIDDAPALLTKAELGLRRTVPILYVPTFAETDELEIARAFGYLTFPIWLSDQMQLPDNLFRNSRGTAMHDVNHAGFSIDNLNKIAMPEPLAPEQSAWLDHVLDEIEGITDVREKRLVEIIYFEVVHEAAAAPTTREMLSFSLNPEFKFLRNQPLNSPSTLDGISQSIHTKAYDGTYGPFVSSDLVGYIDSPHASDYISPFTDIRADENFFLAATKLRQIVESR